MGRRQYTIVFPGGIKELVFIEEADPVYEIRALLTAMLSHELESTKELTLSCQGKRLRDGMGTWEEAMKHLFPQRFVSANEEAMQQQVSEEEKQKERESKDVAPACTTPLSSFSPLLGWSEEATTGKASGGRASCDPFLLKVYCTIGEKDCSAEVSLEAIREVLPDRQRASEEERERNRAVMEPMIDILCENPALMKSFLEKEGINTEVGRIKRLLNDKDTMKKVLTASFDPDAQRRLMQEGSLQLAQAQANPDMGFIVNSMMVNTAKELYEGDMGFFSKGKSVDDEKEDDSLSEGTQRRSFRYEVQKEKIPNPWSQKNTPSLNSQNPFLSFPNSGPSGGNMAQKAFFDLQNSLMGAPSSSSNTNIGMFPRQIGGIGSSLPSALIAPRSSPLPEHNTSITRDSGIIPPPVAPNAVNPLPNYFPSLTSSLATNTSMAPGASCSESLQGSNGTYSENVVVQPPDMALNADATTSSPLEETLAFKNGMHTLINEFGFEDKKLCEEALKFSGGSLDGAVSYLERKQEEEERGE